MGSVAYLVIFSVVYRLDVLLANMLIGMCISKNGPGMKRRMPIVYLDKLRHVLNSVHSDFGDKFAKTFHKTVKLKIVSIGRSVVLGS